MQRRKFGQVTIDLFDRFIPDIVRYSDFFRLRSAIMDNPCRETLNKVRHPIRFVAMGTLFPFIAYFTALWLSTWVGMPTQKDMLERDIKQATILEKRLGIFISENTDFCQKKFRSDSLLQEYCLNRLNRDSKIMLSGVKDRKYDLNLASRFSIEYQDREIFLTIGWIGFALSAYFFAILYNKIHPLHRISTPTDYERCRNYYLIVSGASLFFPSLFAISILILVDLISRISPESTRDLVGLMTMVGGIPLFAGSIIVADRIHRILQSDNTWRISGTFAAIAIANLITNVFLIGGLILMKVLWY